MDIIITRTNTEGNYKSAEMTAGKKSAFVMINIKTNEVNVICKNAAHKAWKGCGRWFDSIQDAVDGYKSTAMKEMIKTIETV